jgi:hypothetical protein
MAFLFPRMLPTAHLLMASVIVSSAQQTTPSSPHSPAGPSHIAVPDVPANPNDVATIDAIVLALYNVISGPVGRQRDWSRMKGLLIPDVRLIATNPDKSGHPNVRSISFQDYADRFAANVLRQPFYEREIHRQTRQFGNIAQLFSSYETTRDGKKDIAARGVNAIQLYFDGNRWWIASIVWDTDRPGNPLPKELAPE